MSIFASIFSIEDEREWMANLEADGIGAGIIRDDGPSPEDLDAPYVYLGSHVLPEIDSPRGGSVNLALIPAHVRFWREHPGDDSAETMDAEPESGCEPYLRIDVHESRDSPNPDADACVVITPDQAYRLGKALIEWSVEADPKL